MIDSKRKPRIVVVANKSIKVGEPTSVIEVDSESMQPTTPEEVVEDLKSMLDKSSTSRLMSNFQSLEQIKMVVDSYLKMVLTNGQLEGLRLYDYIKFDIRFDEESNGRVVEIVPKNLFTALLCIGVFVSPVLLEGESEYETEFGTISMTDEGEVKFRSLEPPDFVVIDLISHLNPDDIGIA